MRRLFRLTLSVTVDENFGFRVDVTPKIAAADGGIIDGDTGDLLRDDTETETGAVAASLWSDPKVDIDQYGEPTGEDCGVEVLTALADCASHRVPTFRLKRESRCLSQSEAVRARVCRAVGVPAHPIEWERESVSPDPVRAEMTPNPSQMFDWLKSQSILLSSSYRHT